MFQERAILCSVIKVKYEGSDSEDQVKFRVGIKPLVFSLSYIGYYLFHNSDAAQKWFSFNKPLLNKKKSYR